MSDLPTGALSYQAVVAEYFLGLRGAGLMISPLDQELVAEWERRGLPVAVVCRGLRRGLEALADRNAPGAPLPRSIRALRFAVEDEWHAYRHDRVGDSPPPPAAEAAASARLDAARALLEEAGRSAPEPHRDGYRDAWRALAKGTDGPGDPLARVEAAIAAADARILASWLRNLPAPERAALGPRLRLLAGPRPRAVTPRAWRDTLRVHLVDLARAAGLTCLRGSV
ncbi:MAG TPA: hypothetical protein VLT61_01325 [Anaeromyxobacteraceae bacterium]|nr:hypothetical protein [Anaeromyxobacteraceae bacterium]